MGFARNVQFAVKNGKVDEFKRLMNTEVLPLLKKESGFKQDLTVMSNHTGMSTSVWDDRASAETYDTKTYPQVLKTLNPVLEGTPRVENFDTILAISRS